MTNTADMIGCEHCDWTGTSYSVGTDGIEAHTCSCVTVHQLRIRAEGNTWIFAADGSPRAEAREGGWIAVVRPSDGALLTEGPRMGTNVPREILAELDRRAGVDMSKRWAS